MKKTIFSVIAILCSNVSFSQETIHIDSVFQNKDENLLFSKVILLDSVSQSNLKQRVKNWAGTTFQNMNEVLVSETESQLVFNYIESSKFSSMGAYYDFLEYTRIIVQLKDNKVKISFFDDGNVFRLGSGNLPSIKARSQYIKDNFKGKEILQNSGLAGKPRYQSVTDYYKRVKMTMLSLESGVKKEISQTIAESDF